MPLSDLIQIDKHLSQRLSLRISILNSHPDSVGTFATAEPAVNELYIFLTSHYLPRRFPGVYKHDWTGSSLMNTVLGMHYPLTPAKSPSQTLIRLNSIIDQDFMLLLPAPDGQGYTLQAYLTCFASGFQVAGLLGKSIGDLHDEVPGYRDKLQNKMERWFEKLPIGKVARRSNVGPNRPKAFDSISRRSHKFTMLTSASGL